MADFRSVIIACLAVVAQSHGRLTTMTSTVTTRTTAPWSTTSTSKTTGHEGSCTGLPCADVTLCRSKWGFCGSSVQHCNAESTWKAAGCGQISITTSTSLISSAASTTTLLPSTTSAKQTIAATTTSSSSNDGSCAGSPCPDATFCRSKWGFCGSSLQYCNSESTWKASGCQGSQQGGANISHTHHSSAPSHANRNVDGMEGSITDIAAPADVSAKRLRGSMPSTAMPESRQLSRRRRRRRKSSNNPCSDIEIAVCKTSEYIFCVAGCLDISSCKDACDKKLYKPCKESLKSACEKSALDICEEAIKKAGEKSCTEICLEAAATADAAGGGPEDPAGDVIAADIEASCEMSCESAVDSSGLTPGTEAFAKAVCKGIGF